VKLGSWLSSPAAVNVLAQTEDNNGQTRGSNPRLALYHSSVNPYPHAQCRRQSSPPVGRVGGPGQALFWTEDLHGSGKEVVSW
jgi:hypothetical protein